MTFVKERESGLTYLSITPRGLKKSRSEAIADRLVALFKSMKMLVTKA